MREITFNELFKRMKKEPKVIVETGTIRNKRNADGHSTVKFAKYVIENGGEFFSVDNNLEAVELSRKVCSYKVPLTTLSSQVNIIHSDSLTFLSDFKQKIDVLYLDSGNDKHLILKEAKMAMSKLKKDSIIMIDDAGEKAEAEKGKLVMPWLEEKGWKVIMNYYQVIFIRGK
jgi:predicted O-methyltransferase YrrM